MTKLKITALLLGLLTAAALATACTDTPDSTDTDTTAAIETVATPDTEEKTEPETTFETEKETTEAETECQLIFEDNFDGTELDAAKWNLGTPENQPARTADVRLWDPAMVELDQENGHLLLKMEWDAEAKKARTGAVTTKGLFEYGYGYYEASVKFPLTYGRSNCFTVTAGGVEMDIMRSINGRDAVTYEHKLSGGGNGAVTVAALEKNLINIYDGRFHTFGLLRTPEGYTFYIDGKESAFIPADQFAPVAEDGFISLCWEASKINGSGRNESLNSTPAEMVVDYVRVYSSLPEVLSKPVNTEPELVFNDDFDGTELDNTKWEKCPEWDRQGKSRWQNDLSYLDGEGNLILKMDWDEEAQLVNCGAVRTAGRFEYGYGYYEARIKFTDHHGAWGAFWMMCGAVSGTENGAADGVEIDIIESIYNQDGIYNHNLHWDGYGADHKVASPTLLREINIYDGEYHTFGVLRSETGYFFYIDGQLSSLVTPQNCEPCPVDGYMKLTCEAAEWSGAGTPESIADMPAEMIVDYVRVWDIMPDFDNMDE